MARPVEINRKNTRLLRIAVAGLGIAVWQIWLNYDHLLPFSWKTVPNLLPIAITAFSGLVALALLLLSLFNRQPYLIVYDNRIEISRAMSKSFWILHFSDVKDLTSKGDDAKKKAVFELQPFLKKSDLPKKKKWHKKFDKTGYTINLGTLEMTSDEAYDLILDNYLAYKKTI